MKPTLKNFSSIFALLALILSAFQGCGLKHSASSNDKPSDKENKPEEFVILFTNDFHSQIEPVEATDRGGILRIKALVDSVRAVEPLVLLADAGDFVQGTFYFSLLDGVVESMALDEMGYDIRCVGNHEFDKKMEGLHNMFCWSKVPVVSTNYDFSASVASNDVIKTHIIDIDGIKVGFVGLGVRLQGLVSPVCCEGVTYVDPVDVAEEAAAKLKKQGADIVIGLSHLGYNAKSDAPYMDRGFVMNTKSIDMIIGGHSHTYLPKAIYVRNLSGNVVPIVQTGSRGNNLGYAKVTLRKSGQPEFEYRLIPVDSRLDDRIDQAFASKISAYSDALKAKVEEVIGSSDAVLRGGSPQSLLGNWTTDALVKIANDYYGVTPDITVYNNGGLRASMPKGEIKIADIYAIYPFDNTLTLLKITGNKVLDLFGRIAQGGYVFNGNVKMVCTSDGQMTSLKINGETVDPLKEYTVATINYLADDKLEALNDPISRSDSFEMIRDLFVDYVRKLTAEGKTINAEYDDRVVIL